MIPQTPQATPWGAIGGFASSLIGLGLNNTMQNQQYNQNVDLMNLQHANQRNLNEQMQDISQQNWDYTNYENQVKHMQNAGLNVGLMYGGAGQGGQSTASSGGSAAMGQAPQNNTPQMLGLMQQAQLNASQIEKINAETNKIKSETPTGGNLGDTNIENTKADTLLKGINTEIAKIQKDIQEGGKEYSVLNIIANAEKAQYEARQGFVKANVDEKTQQTQINTIRQNYQNMITQKSLMESNINVNESQIKQIENAIENVNKQYLLNERGVINEETKTKLNKEYQDSLIKLGWGQVAAGVAGNLIKAL